jgi:hypothetical protein
MAANNSMTQEQMEQFAQSLARLASQVDTTRQGFGPFADAQREAGDELKNGMKQAAQQLGNSVVSLTKAMDPLSGQQGLGKFSGAVSGAADAAGTAAQTMLASFGPLGLVVGTVIKLFGQLAGASLKQNDVMMKAYRDLAETGSVSGSLEKLNTDLHRVGLTSGEAEKFGQMIGKVTPDLAAFGGSVTAGKDKFIKVFEGMIGVGSKTEMQLNRLGYSTDTMREATADYIARQSRLGLTQGKSTEQLRGESVNYMKTLRELQEVTGMSRDEAQKILDQQQKDARWAMTLREIEATQGHEAAERARMGMAAFSQTFGSEAAADLMEQVANKGAIVGEASARSERATLGQGYKQLQAVIDGQITSGQMVVGVSQAVSRNMDALGPAYKISGDGLKDMTGSMGLVTGAYANANKKYEDVNKTLGDKTKIAGDRLQENVEIEQKQRVMRIAADKAIWEIGNVTVGMFQKLNDIMFKFAKTLAQLVDWVNDKVFGKKTNFADMFKDQDDFKNDLSAAKNDKILAEKEAADTKKLYAELEKDSSGKLLQQKIDAAKKGAAENFYYRNADTGEEVGNQQAAALYEEEVKKLEAIQKQIKKEDGTIDLKKLQLSRESKLQDLREKIANDERKMQEAEKRLKTFQAEGTAGNATLDEARQQNVGASKGTAFTTDAKGNQVSQEKFEQRSGAQANIAARAASVDSSEILNKLNFKNKSENTAGGQADPKLLALAEMVQKEFPGATFTALNDAFHKNNRPNSKHTVGKALDFVPGQSQVPKSADEAALIKERLKDLGANVVRDEFFTDKGDSTTGGHFHLEVAREGGLFNGPSSGYPVMLHGKNESAWPEQKLQGLLQDVEKSSVEKYKQELMDKMGLSEYNKPNQTSALASGDSSQLEDLVSRMINKFDTLISLQDKSNNITDELLTYTRA